MHVYVCVTVSMTAYVWASVCVVYSCGGGGGCYLPQHKGEWVMWQKRVTSSKMSQPLNIADGFRGV